MLCLDHLLAVASAALSGLSRASLRGTVSGWTRPAWTRIVDAAPERETGTGRARPAWARLADRLRVVAVAAFAGQGLFYCFTVFPQTILSEGANVLGHTVAEQRPGTFVITLARQNHIVNAGWVQLLAPHVWRGQMKDPGYSLPLAHMQGRALAIITMPFQSDFIPYLKAIYPAGWPEVRYDHTGTQVVTVFHVPDGGVYTSPSGTTHGNAASNAGTTAPNSAGALASSTAGNIDVRVQTAA